MLWTEFVHLMTFVLEVPSFELVVTGTICQLITVSLKSLLSPLWGCFWLLPVGMRDLNIHIAYVSSWDYRMWTICNSVYCCPPSIRFKDWIQIIPGKGSSVTQAVLFEPYLKGSYKFLILPTEDVKPVHVYHRMKIMYMTCSYFFCFKLTFLGTCVPKINSTCKYSGMFLS
jgi:hypothetical protein